MLLKIIFVFLFNSFQVFLVYKYFHVFFDMKVSKKRFILITFIFLLLTKFLPEQSSSFIKMSFFLFSLLTSIVLCFKCSISKLIYHVVFFSLIILLAEMILSMIAQNIAIQYINESFATVIYFMSNIMSLLTALIIINLLIKEKTDEMAELADDEYKLISIIPIFSIISIYWIERYKMIPFIIPCMFFLVINVSLMLLYYRLTNKNFKIQKYMIMKLQNEYYEKSLMDQNENAKLRHDLKNIFINIDYHLANLNVKEARNLLNNVMDINMKSYTNISGCIPIDAILDSKISKMNLEKIVYDLEIQVPSDLKFSNSIDVVAILGNLIDNAIEAVMRLPKNQKDKICIHIKFYSEKLVIKIVNPTNHKFIDLNTYQVKSNKDIDRLGIGISSIKDRVKQLGGYYDFTNENHEFISVVVLPIINK